MTLFPKARVLTTAIMYIMQPLINILRVKYQCEFTSSSFSVKFSENRDSIKLDIPKEEIQRQGYKIVIDVEPCLVP